ncbi:MAG: phosphatase PAP2 family protein [Flavobacteriaceae bacterium]|nr:phosphatase PAP2 family protein [Flavobacteriaceae bacterium]
MRILKNFPVVWWSVIFYFLAVEFIIILKQPEMVFDFKILMNRATYGVFFLISILLKNKLPLSLWRLVNILLIYAGLGGLYKETAVLNQLFLPEIDSWLMELDQKIFGFQPSLEFSKYFNSLIFSEMMFFGYFSYYLMPIAILMIIYKNNAEKMENFGFMLISSFLLYYLIFISLPAFGPQFYFSYPENFIEAQGVFGKIVKIIQENGEDKTAAFPSSHTSLAIIMLLWLYDNAKKYVKFFVPTVVLLILATVYIKAHYAVDVLAGIFTAPVVYYIVNQIFKRLSNVYKN